MVEDAITRSVLDKFNCITVNFDMAEGQLVDYLIHFITSVVAASGPFCRIWGPILHFEDLIAIREDKKDSCERRIFPIKKQTTNIVEKFIHFKDMKDSFGWKSFLLYAQSPKAD